VTVTAPDQISITNLSAPAEAQQSEEITVEVELEHVGTEQTTQNVEFTFGDGLITQTETVAMSPGDTQTVTFDVTIPKDLEPGEYSHGVAVEWDDAGATIEILEGDEAFFEVSDFDAPSEAGQHDTFNASATVENTGDFEATQTIEYEFNVEVDDPPGDDPGLEDVQVGIINYGSDSWKGDYQSILEDQLDTDTYEFSLIDQEDDLESVMGDYDIFVVHRIGLNENENTRSLTEEEELALQNSGGDEIQPLYEDNIQILLDNLEDDQGVVYLDSWGEFSSNYPDGVDALADERGDPVSALDNLGSGADTYHTILEDHPIFDGVGSQGDTVLMKETGYYAYWNPGDYTGTELAEVTEESDGSSPEGISVGVDDSRNEVILGSLALGSTFSDTMEERVDAANLTLANSVEHVAEQALLDGTAATDDNGITTMNGQPIKIHATKTVTLDGGESTTVNFEFEVPGNLPEGLYGHRIASADGEASDEIFIFEQSPDIKVTGHFPEDDELEVGETLVTEAIVVNNGDVAGDRDIRLNVDSEVRDTVTVHLEPDEVMQVNLSTTMTQAGDFVVSVNGQDPQIVTVTDSGTATMRYAADPVAT
jgi:hypothetical protein